MPPANSALRFRRTRVKQVVVVAPAGSDMAPVRASASNDQRVYFSVQNTGTNPGYFSWDEAFPGQLNHALLLMPGDTLEWRDPVPTQAANYQSPLGTTFAVIEGWPPNG